MSKCSCVSRTTILAAVAFLDAFQKVADMATNSRGKAFVLKTGVSMLGMVPKLSFFKLYIRPSKQE